MVFYLWGNRGTTRVSQTQVCLFILLNENKNRNTVSNHKTRLKLQLRQ
jgi:hypothetical protein